MYIPFITREKGDDIIENQLNIISRIKKLNDEYSYITNELTMANNLLRNINTKSNSNKLAISNIESKVNETKSKSEPINITDKIITELKEINSKACQIETAFNNTDSTLKNIDSPLKTIECSLKDIDIDIVKSNFIQMKNAPFGILTGMITIGLILIVSVLTVLPFFFMKDQMEIVYFNKWGGDAITYIPLGIILIPLALVGIWSLVFMYIKSRIKTHEQDSTFLRRFLHDN